jgi:hypothetical protein
MNDPHCARHGFGVMMVHPLPGWPVSDLGRPRGKEPTGHCGASVLM